MADLPSTAVAAAVNPKRSIVVDPFCFRQFREYYTNESSSSDYTGTIFDVSISEFERIVNERYTAAIATTTTTPTTTNENNILQAGYAPFCKHFFIDNDFTTAVVNVLPITTENEHLLRSKYVARNEHELPVLVRYFPSELVQVPNQPLPTAKHLDLILYSREQINLENQATKTTAAIATAAAERGDATRINNEAAPWGIVSIKAQDRNVELPMTPITNMRNALGKEYGGSGIPLNRDQYMECIHYWNDHATIS